MTAPQVEPLKLTLEALAEAVEHTYGLVKATGAYYSPEAEDALVRAKAGIESLGVPVVERRDDTAELVEMLESFVNERDLEPMARSARFSRAARLLAKWKESQS